MKIKKVVQIDKALEFEVTAHDLIEDMRKNPDTADGIMDACNKFYVYLSAAPDSAIAGIIDANRIVIAGFLRAQADRFYTKETDK